MNYRHIYHAGNICDVVKHIVLVMLLEHLRAKDSGFCVLDTHAGIGLYDLQDERAQKTQEANAGIVRLLDGAPLAVCPSFYSVLQKHNRGWQGEGYRFYPGSPMFVAELLRPQDRLIACELHEEDTSILRRIMRHTSNAAVHFRDGYGAVRAFLPPAEKRGLVLIDPPYEQPDEFTRLVEVVQEAHQRWPQGMLMLWYPVKERPNLWRFHEALMQAGIPKQLCAEFIYQDELRADRLNGSGFILINPPWQFDDKLRALFPILHDRLRSEHKGTLVKWLVGEAA
jgi:23S rRNA (adenine2030-N6)-methyltransferase